ncbi:MAG: Flagellar hook-associated protein FliD, partial [Myxococcaceae bacterium]|nr:Flagellar hook-associated protein FliD [Myxococcaceae bacterium]
VSVAKIPMTQIQKTQSTLSSQSKKFSDIKTQLTTLQTAAKALDTKTEALANKVTSSTESVVTATAQGGSSAGSFKIDVTQLAQAERTYSNEFDSDSTEGVAAGELTIQVGTGDAFKVDVTDTDTLASVAKKINASGAGVSAGIFHDGSKYRLQITGSQTGAANKITFGGDAGTALGLLDADNEKQQATDAVITIDKMEVHSATNAITGAVPGVTLNVASLGSSTIKVDRDGDGLQTKLQTFVTAYNAVMTTMNKEFSTTSGVTKAADTLSGDATLRTLQSSLRNLASKVMGNGESKFTTFGSIGLTSQRDGTFTLDTAKLTAAVSSDYDGVASLLAGRTDGTGLMNTFSTGVDAFTKSAGTLDNKISSIAQQNKTYDAQLLQMQSRVDKYEQGLNDQFAALEKTMSDLKSQGNALSSIISG